ncbi:MAG TPA: hypothetical protein VHM25_01775 [Polyangiaceae bacterium]|jgi:hypothetical protein|nr:hypothetical protein [Polyangiaceae bacterium]
MVPPFKKLLSKLELPKNDWVLSRFGGCEPPSNPVASDDQTALVEDEAPVSQAPPSVAARLLNRLFDVSPTDDVAVPPQSGARVSSNASDDDELSDEDERKSRAS